MQHFIYKTTCLTTGKFYVGMHSTTKKNDTYLGSGNILRSSIKKHGRQNHVREILATAPSREELRLLEARMVTVEMISDPLCMNLAVGGCGSGVGRVVTEKTRSILREQRKGWAHMSPEIRERTKRELSERQSQRTGEKHPRATLWRLCSPTGEIFETRALRDFCEERGLAWSAFRNKRTSNNSEPIGKGASAGWALMTL